MVNKFTDEKIKATLKLITDKYHFKPEYLMSTSGDFFVMTLKKDGKKFILKMRKNKGILAKIKFLNEIKVIKYLNKKNIIGLTTTKIFITQIKNSPEYFIYEYIKGYPLNSFYIAIGKRLTNKFLETNFLKIFENLHALKLPYKIKLIKNSFSANLQIFKDNEIYLKKYINKNLLNKINHLLVQQGGLLNKLPLVLTHGDINPKNIVLTKNKLALIDWSEVHLNNPLFDLSSLYLFAWNRPEIKKHIKEYILNQCSHLSNPYHVFLLNRLILIPKNIRIMENSIQGLILDKKNKIILPKTEKKLKLTAQRAIANYVDEAKRIVEYLELWQKPNSIVRSIEKFYDYKSAYRFFLFQTKKLDLNKTWYLKKITTHRFVVRTGDQKLITEYLFSNGKKNKIIMGKIRLERGDDLAKQSYYILKKIWHSLQGKKIITKPLCYFSKYHFYLYEKTLGHSLAEIIENKKNRNKKFLLPLIKKSATLMSALHQIPIKYFQNVNFYKNYDLAQQLNWLENNLYKNKKFKTSKNLILLKNLQQLLKKTTEQRKSDQAFIHGDFQLQNLILQNNKLRMIDFDNAEINDPLIDVGNFLNQINYKNLLVKNSYSLRQAFLQTYLKLSKQKLEPKLVKILNFYIIMGIIKNINLNFLENKLDLVIYDLKKINYIYNNLTINPVDNLRNVKKILT